MNLKLDGYGREDVEECQCFCGSNVRWRRLGEEGGSMIHANL